MKIECLNPCHARVASLQRSHIVLRIADHCYVSAVQSHVRYYAAEFVFEHAQNKRRGWAFIQRVRQRAAGTLLKGNALGLLERRGRVVGTPRARCKDAIGLHTTYSVT